MSNALRILPLALLIVLSWSGCQSPPPEIIRNIPRSPAPDFSLPSHSGETKSSSEIKGQITLLHFWATWSPASLRDVQTLSRLQEEFGPQGVRIIGIALEESGAADLTAFLKQSSFNYPILVAETDFHQRFGGIDAIPTTFVIDSDWHLVNRHTGVLPYEMLRTEISAMLWELKEKQRAAAQ